MKRILSSLFAVAALSLAVVAAAPPALAGNTTLYSPTKGDLNFPIVPPTKSAPGTMDNTTIGATTPAAGTFTSVTAPSGLTGPVAATTLSASSTVSGTGFTNRFASPGPIGNTAASTGVFTIDSAASFKGTGSAPTPTGTGTPTIATGSTNSAGEVTAGTSATSVVITFAGAPLANAPFCAVTTQTGGIVSFAYAITTSAITVTQTATSGDLIDYVCLQH